MLFSYLKRLNKKLNTVKEREKKVKGWPPCVLYLINFLRLFYNRASSEKTGLSGLPVGCGRETRCGGAI